MNQDGKKFNEIQHSSEHLELSSSSLATEDVNIDGGDFRISEGSGSNMNKNLQENDRNFEEYVKRPFEGSLTLDEPVSVTIVK